MKKSYILSFTAVLLLVGCGENNAADEETNTENASEDTNEGQNNEPAEEEKAADVLEKARAELGDMNSVYRERPFDSDDDDPDVTGTEKEWVFIEDGEVFIHREREFPEEDTRTHVITDRENPAYAIFYEEGDEEAIRYEPPEAVSEEEVWFRQFEELLEGVLQEGEFSYEGEEEINGYQTHEVEMMYIDISNRWFNEETHFQVRAEIDIDLEGPGVVNTNMEERELTEEVYDYEINPAFDESLFELPEDLEIIEGSYEDVPEEAREVF